MENGEESNLLFEICHEVIGNGKPGRPLKRLAGMGESPPEKQKVILIDKSLSCFGRLLPSIPDYISF